MEQWRGNLKSTKISGNVDIKLKRSDKNRSIEEDLKAVNPNYGKSFEWNHNCQRCVPVYEMRRRGYAVTAKPLPDEWLKDFLSQGGNYSKVFKNPQIMKCAHVKEIESLMQEWGTGARAEVCIVWKSTQSVHLFAVENRSGKIHFVDPQTGESDVKYYFEYAKKEFIFVHRTDNLEFTDLIKECYEEISDD